MAVMKSVLLAFAVLCVACCNALVCSNGYSVNVLGVSNCAGPNAIVSLGDRAGILVNDDCSLSLQGCVAVKSFNTATGTILVTKNGKKLFGRTIDLCNPSLKNTFLAYLLPGGVCPQSERVICANANLRLPVGDLLPLLQGRIVIELSADHDTGRSCLRVEAEVSK